MFIWKKNITLLPHSNNMTICYRVVSLMWRTRLLPQFWPYSEWNVFLGGSGWFNFLSEFKSLALDVNAYIYTQVLHAIPFSRQMPWYNYRLMIPSQVMTPYCFQWTSQHLNLPYCFSYIFYNFLWESVVLNHYFVLVLSGQWCL